MQVPRTNAIAVAPNPTLIEVPIAGSTPLLSVKRPHHTVEIDEGGQEKVRDGLNELSATTIKGK